MQIKDNILLAPYTTFKIGGPARYFCCVKNQQEALEAYEFAKEKNLPVLVLGGGSNILVSDDGFNGLVVKVDNKGIEVIKNGTGSRIRSGMADDEVLLKVASGEVWDEVVSFAVKNNWWGIENLSHIPGSTGAIAVQNVGAYGQEAKNVIESVTVFNKETHEIQSLKNSDCDFSYRSSIFNSKDKGKYIIFYITFRLSKMAEPILIYRDLQNRFEGKQASPAEIRQAVIEIRDTKFPFPSEAKKGNAGSFFKNLILDKEAYQGLKERIGQDFGQERSVELEKKKFAENGRVKIPAAFLIELCGLKDLKNGGAAINHNQPLVIINESGKATATDVLKLARQVIEAVYKKTGVTLSIEPELVGF